MARKRNTAEDTKASAVSNEIKNETLEKETVKVETKPKKLRISQIEKDTEIAVKNITNGGLVYRAPKTGYVYRLGEYGNEDYLTFDEILVMRNSDKKFFDEYWLIISEVPNKEYTVEQIVEALGLNTLYDGSNSVVLDLDGFIYGNVSTFKNTFPKVDKKIQDIVIKRVQHLYRQNEIRDVELIQYLIEFKNDKELFVF